MSRPRFHEQLVEVLLESVVVGVHGEGQRLIRQCDGHLEWLVQGLGKQAGEPQRVMRIGAPVEPGDDSSGLVGHPLTPR